MLARRRWGWCSYTAWLALFGCGEPTAGSVCALPCSGAGGAATTSAGAPAAASGTTSSSGASALGGATATAGSSAGGMAGASGGTGTPSGPLPPSYEAVEYRLPEPQGAPDCSGASNASAVIEHVAFAQTHSFEPSWPLFFLVANRPALLEVAVTGAGPAPEVRAEAFADGQSLGRVCLQGPTTLPASVKWAQRDADDRYRGGLPSDWLRPGLSVKVTAGSATQSFDAEQLHVGAAPELNLIMLPIDVLSYNEGKPDIAVPEAWLEDFAGAVPAARVRLGHFPGRVVLKPLVVSADASGGIPPTRLEKRPCDGDEPAGSDCQKADIPRMNISAAALRMIGAIHRATGDYAYAHYYGNTEHFNPGGWGGGKDFVGADFDDIFIHEMGHALSLPHWGQGSFQNTSPGAGDHRYPYGGNGADGGGRGETWNYYQNTGEYASPVCQDENNQWFGQERSDAMQRNCACIEWRGGKRGRWDGYGDFSALAAFRFLAGAEERAGTVPYRGQQAPFHLAQQSGYPSLVIDARGQRRLVRQDQPEATSDEERYDFLLPQAWDEPVATVYGSYHPSFAEANVLYAPIEYRGTLPRVIDPTDPDTFERLRAVDGPYDDYFYWPKDLNVKVIYADGTELVALLVNQGTDRSPELGSGPWRGDLIYFAVNVPRPLAIRKVELYRRPFVVRGANASDDGNIRNPSLGITAASFMNDAKLVTSWQAP